MRILVIDDEPAVAAVIAEALREEGHEVSAAGGGGQGRASLMRPDVWA